jgi:uncharacterized membrane protein
MKHSDIIKLHEAGLITEQQRDQITARYQLKEDGNKFLAVISILGGLLVAAGVVLLIAANWDEIPRWVKLASGLALMLGAHAGGWQLRTSGGKYPKTGEALHFLGALLFLANIAMVGQIYHLSSHTPNAFLLWWAGIATLPWILRSPALHVLSLVSFGTWFGCEMWSDGGWFAVGGATSHPLNFALLGLGYLGFGYTLRRFNQLEFAPVTEQIGLWTLHCLLWPLTWGDLYLEEWNHDSSQPGWLFAALSVAGLGLVALGLSGDRRLSQQWRRVWGCTLAGVVALAGAAIFVDWMPDQWWRFNHGSGFNGIAAIVLIAFCLVQIQVGVQLRARHMVNMGILFIALNLIATYLVLIGSMAQTGLMFVVSGVFLIAFGIYLEKKRRGLMQRIKAARPEAST